jgi:uncharacterized protein YqhQ
MSKEEKIQVGGQAVIEGVMMRSPERVAIAVRKPNEEIAVKQEEYVSYTKRHRLWGWPVIRGGVTLIESLYLGVKAITYSADVAIEDEKQAKKKKPRSRFWEKASIVLTVVVAFAFGFLVFFYIPLILTELVGSRHTVLFNLIDGAFRLAFFLAYIFLITRWKEMRKIFRYHGAEHMSIYTFEAGDELTVENARKHTTMHPRCGTSFLLVVMLVSIVVFVFLGRPEAVWQRVMRFLFIPVIGGISYELIKLSNRFQGRWARVFIAPGLWLQKMTTGQPDDKQLEVALVALKAALGKV